MIIQPYEYNLDLPRIMSYHLVPHMPRLVLQKTLIYIIILQLKVDK